MSIVLIIFFAIPGITFIYLIKEILLRGIANFGKWYITPQGLMDMIFIWLLMLSALTFSYIVSL